MCYTTHGYIPLLFIVKTNVCRLNSTCMVNGGGPFTFLWIVHTQDMVSVIILVQCRELSHCPLETLLGIDGVSEHFRLQM